MWSGSAITVLTGGQDSHDASVLPTRLEWTLRPRWNGLSLHLTQDCCLAHGMDVSVRRTLDAWQVDVVGPDERDKPAGRPRQGQPGAGGADAAALASATPLGQWPMGWLEGRGFPWNTIHPGGVLTLSTHDLSFALKGGHWSTLGSAQVEIRQAVVAADHARLAGHLPRADPAGSEHADQAGRRRLARAGVDLDPRRRAADQGPRPDRRHGRAHPRRGARGPGSEAALDNLLNLIGRRNGATSAISIG